MPHKFKVIANIGFLRSELHWSFKTFERGGTNEYWTLMSYHSLTNFIHKSVTVLDETIFVYSFVFQ